jgi:phage regulator Rha-like protein
MSSLTVVEQQGILVVDSRLIAEELGLNHSDWVKNVIKKYQSLLEANFGILRFENGEIRGRGQPEKFAWLLEDQATFLMTLSRNTEQVISAKINLVKAFTEAKKRLANQVVAQPMTQIQMVVVMATQLAAQEQQLLQQEARLAAVEAEQQRYLAPCGHKYTVMGFANIKEIKISAVQAAVKGRAASRICSSQGIEVERVYDPRFGKVGLYPEDVLAQVFKG